MEYTNTQDALRSKIAEYHKGGFSVVLQDLDSGEYVPMAKVFPLLADAQAYAKKIVNA